MMKNRRGEVVLCNALLAILEKKFLKSDHEVSASCQKKPDFLANFYLRKLKVIIWISLG